MLQTAQILHAWPKVKAMVQGGFTKNKNKNKGQKSPVKNTSTKTILNNKSP